jgi:putative nucleotidyltransferase with HDIG domain
VGDNLLCRGMFALLSFSCYNAESIDQVEVESVILEEQVIAWLAQQDIRAYLVGGCVRDRLLHRPIYDLDVATAGDGLVLARSLADHFGGDYYALDSVRRTGRAILHREGLAPLVVDVARFRGDDLAADLDGRDFTLNALAVDVRAPDEIIDRHGGLADLGESLIRPVSDGSIRNDPLRALRAVRQAAQLDLALAPETERLIRRDGPALVQVPGERVRDELARLLALPMTAAYLDQLDDLGILTVILPELEPLRGLVQPPPHHLEALPHSLDTVRSLELLLAKQGLPEALSSFSDRLYAHVGLRMCDARPRLVTLKLAALLHDTGKPAARGVDNNGRVRFIGHHQQGAEIAAEAMRRLRFSSIEVRLGETIVRYHMRPLLLANQESVSSRAVYRFFRDIGQAGVDVLLHALADHRATVTAGSPDEVWLRLVNLTARMLGDYWERQSERVKPAPLVTGYDLLHELGLQPGPQIGELLEAVLEAQVSGEVSTRAEALALVRAKLGGDA